MDTRKRSLVKSITWRIIAAAITFVTILYFTQTLERSLKITLVAEVIITVAYYFHERLWNRIRWGRTPSG